MRRFRLFGMALLLVAAPVNAGWEEQEVDGKPYVTARSLAEFYRFEAPRRDGAFLVLRNAAIECRLPLEGRFAEMNGLRVDIENPLRPAGERYLVPRVTLMKTIEPLFRPHNFPPEDRLKVLTLQADPASGPFAGNLVQTLAQSRLWSRIGLEVRRLPDARSDAPAGDAVRELNRLQGAHAILIRVASADEMGLRSRVLAPVGVAGFGNALRDDHFEPLPGNAVDTRSLLLAAAVHRSLVKDAEWPDRGLVRSRDPWLKACRHPAVILEFQVPPEDSASLVSRTLTGGLAAGVRGYLDAVDPPAKEAP